MPFGFVSSDSVGGAGGTCVLRGCVPKKLMVYAAAFPKELKESRGFGCVINDDSSRHLSKNQKKTLIDEQVNIWKELMVYAATSQISLRIVAASGVSPMMTQHLMTTDCMMITRHIPLK